MEDFLSPNSSEDQRSDEDQSQIIGGDAGVDHTQIIRGDADVDHTQIIGGDADEDHTQIIGRDTVKLLGAIYPPIPLSFGTPNFSIILMSSKVRVCKFQFFCSCQYISA